MNAILNFSNEFDPITNEFLLRVYNICLEHDKNPTGKHELTSDPYGKLIGKHCFDQQIKSDIDMKDLNKLLNPAAELHPRYRVPEKYCYSCLDIYTPNKNIVINDIPEIDSNIKYDLWMSSLKPKHIDMEHLSVLYVKVSARHVEFIKSLVSFFAWKDKYQMPTEGSQSYSFICDGSLIKIASNPTGSKSVYEFRSIEEMVKVFWNLDAQEKCWLFYETVTTSVKDNKCQYVSIPYFNDQRYLTELAYIIPKLRNDSEYVNRMIVIPSNDDDNDCTLAMDCRAELEGEECEMD